MDTSLGGWLDELKDSGASLAPYLASLAEDKAAYIGQTYKNGQGKRAPENSALQWLALMRGQCLMGNPQYRWESRLPGDPQARAAALTMATNIVSNRLQLRNVNEQLLMDFGFKWCVALTKNAPAPGVTDVRMTPKWPAVYRISPTHFRYDMGANRPEARAWQGHLVIASRRKLMDDPGWNRDAIEKLGKQNVTKFRDKNATIPDRDELAYWEIWCPEEELDESPGPKKGYHGTLFTVADQQDPTSGWIRDPLPYFGMPWGPYVCGGDYLVPDESTPMGAITAASSQSHWLNKIKLATARAIENYKRLVVVRNGSNLAEMIQNGGDQWVFSIEDASVRDAVQQLELAGATDQHFVAQQDAQLSLDTVLGITELMKGRVDPNNKATADALAAQASSNRTSGTVSKFYDVNCRIGYNLGYLIDADDEVEIELGPQAEGMFVDAQGNPTTRLKGGRHPQQDPEEFFNLDMSLKVGSMERSLELDSQMQAAMMDQTLAEVATYGLQTALYYDWDAHLEGKAEIAGMPILKRLVDTNALRGVAAAMMQAGQLQPPTGGTTQKPKMEYGGNPLPKQAEQRAGTARQGGPKGPQKPLAPAKAKV